MSYELCCIMDVMWPLAQCYSILIIASFIEPFLWITHGSSLFTCINLFNPLSNLVRQAFTEEETPPTRGLICPGLQRGGVKSESCSLPQQRSPWSVVPAKHISSRPLYSLVMCHRGLNDSVFQDSAFKQNFIS